SNDSPRSFPRTTSIWVIKFRLAFFLRPLKHFHRGLELSIGTTTARGRSAERRASAHHFLHLRNRFAHVLRVPERHLHHLFARAFQLEEDHDVNHGQNQNENPTQNDPNRHELLLTHDAGTRNAQRKMKRQTGGNPLKLRMSTGISLAPAPPGSRSVV